MANDTTSKTSATQKSLDAEAQRRLNEQAARVLGLDSVHVETINARTLSHQDIQRIAASGEFTFDAYIADSAGFLMPAEFKVDLKRRYADDPTPHEPIFEAVENTKPGRTMSHRIGDWSPNRDKVVGHEVHLRAMRANGRSSEITLWTTPEAEEAKRLLTGHKHTTDGRNKIFVADSDAEPRPLTPIYGSQASVSFIVQDIEASELAERVRRALTAEFGEALGKNMKVRTRPVANHRVDVYTPDGEEVLAINILEAETALVMERSNGGVQVRTHSLSDVMVG